MTMVRRNPLFPRFTLAAGAAGVVVALSAAPALAQMVCGNHADIEKRLQEGYSEIRTGVGLAGNGGLIELYTSEKGTFTIVLTRPNGMSCLMAVGENWEQVKDPTPVGNPA